MHDKTLRQPCGHLTDTLPAKNPTGSIIASKLPAYFKNDLCLLYTGSRLMRICTHQVFEKTFWVLKIFRVWQVEAKILPHVPKICVHA